MLKILMSNNDMKIEQAAIQKNEVSLLIIGLMCFVRTEL
jgi:hypothetical protein